MPTTYNGLISAEQLNQSLSEPDRRIIDCRFRLTAPDWGHGAYLRSHIPGALYADLDQDLAGPVTTVSGRHPLPDLSDFLGLLSSWGVASGSRVVCYDSAGGAIAVRLWWMLRHWLGFEQVQLLDGGWSAWMEYVGRVETGDAIPQHTQPVQCAADQHSWLSVDQIEKNLETGAYSVLDARSAERFAGIKEPIDPVAGHIPFANNRPMTENLTEQGLFKSPDQLRDEFSALLGDRIRPGQIVHSCGSGVTACHNLFAMELAGLPGSKLYPGSWSEWLRDPLRPIVAVGADKHRG